MSDPRPIGVFDSGVGGLTVLRALRDRLPTERLLYVGDLANFPYGPRYQHEVREFSLRIIEHFLQRDVKLVVIACNTATAAALNTARERFDIPLVGVIGPGAQAAVETTRNGRIAVISTEGVFDSREYLHAIKEANPGVGVLPKAAPGLVEIVEQGDADTPRADAAVREVLGELLDWRADTLVLGCTHYPLLRPAIARVAGDRFQVVDSAATTAARVERILESNRLAAGAAPASAPELFTTADPRAFTRTAGVLFGERVAPPLVLALGQPARAS